MYIKQFATPIISCFGDPEAKVRYFACEALYNVCKVVRAYILEFFNETFDSLCKVTILMSLSPDDLATPQLSTLFLSPRI